MSSSNKVQYPYVFMFRMTVQIVLHEHHILTTVIDSGMEVPQVWQHV